jgi:hypothetical protein
LSYGTWDGTLEWLIVVEDLTVIIRVEYCRQNKHRVLLSSDVYSKVPRLYLGSVEVLS